MKKIIPVLLICIIAVLFSACSKNIVIEEHVWQLESAKSFKNPNEKINIGDVYLEFKDDAFVITDKTNDETYNGAYEELYVTDYENDYQVIVEGTRGNMELFESDEDTEDSKVRLRLTLDEYDLCFVIN